MAATDAVAAISLAEIGQRAVGVAQTAVQYFETATIATPLGALPVFVILHAVALTPAFRTPRSAAARYPVAELACFLMIVLAGQLSFAYMASVPLPILESSVALPTYLSVWTLAYLSELVYGLLASSGFGLLGRAVGAGMTGLGVTVYGVDWAVHHGPTAAFRSSLVAALAMAIVPNVTGAVLHVLVHLGWSAHPSAPRHPLPILWQPDYGLGVVRNVGAAALAYYLLLDPHAYAARALTAFGYDGATFYRYVHYFVAPLTARLLVHVALLFIEFSSSASAPAAGAGTPLGTRSVPPAKKQQ